MDTIIPDDSLRQAIEETANSGCCLCWTCGTCDCECPINLSTGRLRPQLIVRMANFGLLDDLLEYQPIWYCLGCRRCAVGCPNKVQPFEVTRYIRNEMFRTGRIDFAVQAAHHELLGKFQRVRYRSIRRTMHSEAANISDFEWYQWLEKPVKNTFFKEFEINASSKSARYTFPAARMSRTCITCSECTNCCPIFFERTVFDPQSVIRMVHFGLVKELLYSPSIWMCLNCHQCARTCTQSVAGNEIIRSLRVLAIEQGCVDPGFPARLAQLERLLYPRLLDEIDHLTGMFGLRCGSRNRSAFQDQARI